ncbi:MAG: hypothetical protein LBK60_06430 [Verrucomicrobiales bacterium]|jgi:hypothetical protein|nr:hypothetical protein [Verrucomicrobiales bacterium]
MGSRNNDGLDDVLVFDACVNFGGGQRSRVRPGLLEVNQFATGRNFDLDRQGDLITRRGAVRLGDALPGAVRGLFFYFTPDVQQLLAVSGGKVWRLASDDAEALADAEHYAVFEEVAGYTPSEPARVELAQLVDKLYLTDGAGHLFQYDGADFIDLGQYSTAGADASKPPRCKWLVAHMGRLLAAGTRVADELVASDFLDGGHWDYAHQSIRVGNGDGDPITALCPWENWTLIVGKAQSVWLVNADATQGDASMWTVQAVSQNVGCVAHRTMKAFGKDVWFLSRSGVHTVQKLALNSQYQVTDPVSEPIQDLIDRVNWDAADTACAAVWNNRYILAVPLDGADAPNTVLVYNAITQSWTTPWTGWTPTGFTVSGFGGRLRLNFGQPDGRVLRWLDYVPEMDAHCRATGVSIGGEVLSRRSPARRFFARDGF